MKDDDNARPIHPVWLWLPFYLGEYHVTRGQYAAFAKATNRKVEDPPFDQTDNHPVVNVSWDDARAYVVWLSQRTGKSYRLPSEAEWEYAARAGTQTARYWGDSADLQCQFADGDDQTKTPGGKLPLVAQCSTGFNNTSPVGTFKPNAFGLSDMLGDAWQWMQDCTTDNYNSASPDGSAYATAICSSRVLRGGSWSNMPRRLRSGVRGGNGPGNFSSSIGFRVARTLSP